MRKGVMKKIAMMFESEDYAIAVKTGKMVKTKNMERKLVKNLKLKPGEIREAKAYIRNKKELTQNILLKEKFGASSEAFDHINKDKLIHKINLKQEEKYIRDIKNRKYGKDLINWVQDQMNSDNVKNLLNIDVRTIFYYAHRELFITQKTNPQSKKEIERLWELAKAPDKITFSNKKKEEAWTKKILKLVEEG